MSHSCCPVLFDLLLASRAVNQVWRQERKVRLRIKGEGTERWVLQAFCSRPLTCRVERQRSKWLKPFFCLCRPLGYNSTVILLSSKAGCSHSHMLLSAHFLQLLSLLVPQFTAGHFSNLAEWGGFVSSCVGATEGVASCNWEGGNKVWGRAGLLQTCFAAKKNRWMDHTRRHCSTPWHFSRMTQRSCVLSRKPPRAGRKAAVVVGRYWRCLHCRVGVHESGLPGMHPVHLQSGWAPAKWPDEALSLKHSLEEEIIAALTPTFHIS